MSFEEVVGNCAFGAMIACVVWFVVKCIIDISRGEESE